MRFLWNKAYRGVFYLGVYCGLWKGPQHYTLEELHLKHSDFNRHIAKIALALQTRGFEAYIVGGSLRDLLAQQKIKPKDFDIVTSADPKQVKKCFPRSRIIGKRFRLVHVPAGGDIVEVSTFRGRSSWLASWRGARYKNNIYGNIEQDAWRRDFSCNALYYDVKNAIVIDFTDGVKDIQSKQLKVIGCCAKRFTEDPVRILRALRFMAKTGFEIDQDMQSEIKRKVGLLRQVSRDRLLLEVMKLFSQGHAVASFKALKEYNCLGVLFSGYERLSIQMDQHDTFLNTTFQYIDQRYKENKRLSSSFLFAVLLWPILEVHKKNLKKMTIYHYKKCIYRVLKFESRYIAIPKKLQDAIKDLWILQYLFESKTTPFSEDKERQSRFQHGYKLFMLRSKSDETLTEKAVMWQAMIEKTNNK